MPEPAGTPSASMDTYLHRAWALSSVPDATALYTEWAETYDADLLATHYASPRRAVRALLPLLSDGARVLDAGCGTGLAGEWIRREGAGRGLVVDGMDLTQGMLDLARRKQGVYERLWAGDLNEGLGVGEGVYDGVICVGTLTKGHVGPGVLEEFVRVVKTDGVVVGTVHEDIWKTGGFEAEVERLVQGGKAELASKDAFGILEGSDKGGIMLVLRKK